MNGWLGSLDPGFIHISRFPAGVISEWPGQSPGRVSLHASSIPAEVVGGWPGTSAPGFIVSGRLNQGDHAVAGLSITFPIPV